jgi:pimeloyl-ACP methyl ester carboxylesterase
MNDNISTLKTSQVFHPTVAQYSWWWQGQEFKITYEVLGAGKPVLLLPAFSTVSSRGEMSALAQLLALEYQVYSLDWLGFGDSQRPAVDYAPALYQKFLGDFVQHLPHIPLCIIAAGHAAGYALQVAHDYPELVEKIVLVAPTWRGPLQVMGVSSQVRGLIKNLVRSPRLGSFLYYLNTTPSFLRFMYRRHVYVEANRLTADFIHQKREITQHSGARFAPVAFVTGFLDPFASREEILALINSLSPAIFVVIAAQSPPYSLGEMEAIASLPAVQSLCLKGTLGIHEEYPEAVAQGILPFLRDE